MSFKEWDIDSEIMEKIEYEKGFKESYDKINKEYDLIRQQRQIINYTK